MGLSEMKTYEILVVEDNTGDQLLIKKGFNSSGLSHRLHWANDGVDALAFLDKSKKYDHPKPDLIIMDLNLTRKDGREVLDEVKKDPELKKIPVVVFSTSGTDQDVSECYALGANAFLTKPVDLKEFLDCIRTIGHFWLEKACLPCSLQ